MYMISVYYITSILVILILVILVSKREIITKEVDISMEFSNPNAYDEKICKLTINCFRTVTTICGCIIILCSSLRFKSLVKTSDFGMTLLNLDYGILVFAHSLRVIRNPETSCSKSLSEMELKP